MDDARHGVVVGTTDEVRAAVPASLPDAARDLVLGTGCVGCTRPGRVLCRGCRRALPRKARPAWPAPSPPGLAPPFAAGAYDGLLRSLVLEHKEHGVFALAGPLGEVLAAVVGDLAERAGTDHVTLVPVPSRRAVVRRRGHDPLLRTARQAAGRLRRKGLHAVVRVALVPVGHVLDQAGLTAGERSANLAGTMACRRVPPRAGGAGLLLVVDDVITTGATLREAQRALEDAGAHVDALAAVAATRRERAPRAEALVDGTAAPG